MPPTRKNPKKSAKAELDSFFEEQFTYREFVNIKDIYKQTKKPVLCKFLSVEEGFMPPDTEFGVTNKYWLDVWIEDDKVWVESSFLCQGKAFYRGIKQFVRPGEKITISKNEQGFWRFSKPDN